MRWGGVNPRRIFGTKTRQGRAMPSSPRQIGTTRRGGTYPFSPHRNGNDTARRSMPPRLVLWSCVVISSIPNKNNNLRRTLYTRPLIVSTPPLHVPCCPRLLGVFVLLRLCFAGRVALARWVKIVSKGVTRSHQPATPAIPVKPVSRVRVFWGFELPTRTRTRDDP